MSCRLGGTQVLSGLSFHVARGESAEALNEAAFRYTKLSFKDDRLVGALSIGRTDNIGVLRGLIETRVSLGPWKERLKKDPNRITEAYIARNQ